MNQVSSTSQMQIIQKPVVRCISHPNSDAQLINLDLQKGPILACINCFINFKFDHHSIVNIDQLFSADQCAIANWPPFSNKQMLEQFNQLQRLNDFCKIWINKIQFHFIEIKNRAVNSFENHEKQIKILIDQINEQRVIAISEYNDYFDLKGLQRCFVQYSTNQQQLKQQLESRVLNVIQNKSEIEKRLQLQLDKYEEQLRKFSFSSIQSTSQKILQFIDSIQYLNPLISIQDQLKLLEQRQNEINQDNQMQKVETIIKLVGNRTNNCKQEFVQNLKTILMENQQIFQLLDFDNIYQNNKRPINFSEFSQIQMDWIESIQQTQYQQVQQNVNNSNLINMLQQNQNSPTFLLQSQLIIKELEQLNKQNQENIINNLLNKFNKFNLLDSIDIIRSQLPFSQFSINTVKTINGIEIQNDSREKSWRQVFVSKEITQGDKYQIQIELQSKEKNNDEIFIGLIPQTQIHQGGWKSNLSLYTQNIENRNFGLNDVVEGKHIKQIKSDVTSLVFQISLNENIYQCSAIANSRRNVVSLSNWANLDRQQKYYFYVSLYHAKAKVILKEFSIVSSFQEV